MQVLLATMLINALYPAFENANETLDSVSMDRGIFPDAHILLDRDEPRHAPWAAARAIITDVPGEPVALTLCREGRSGGRDRAATDPDAGAGGKADRGGVAAIDGGEDGLTGVANRFDAQRGFGFIRPDSGQPDVFVHVKDVRAGGKGSAHLHRSSSSSCMSSSTGVPALICTGPFGPGRVISCVATQSPSAFLVNASHGCRAGGGEGPCCALEGSANQPAMNTSDKSTRVARNSMNSAPLLLSASRGRARRLSHP